MEDRIDRIVDELPTFDAEWFPKSVDAVDAEAVFAKPVVNAIFPLQASDEKKAVETTLPSNALEPCQPYLYKKELKDYMRHLPPELPLVVLYNGRYFVQNHRRVAAQILNGVTNVRVRLLQFDGNKYHRPKDA